MYTPLLEPGKSHSLPGLQSPIEVLEGSFKVSQGLLWGTLGDLVHPWEDRSLQSVQFSVLCNSTGKTLLVLILTVECNSLLQTPVVSKTRTPGMLREPSPLLVVWVQFVFEGPRNQH